MGEGEGVGVPPGGGGVLWPGGPRAPRPQNQRGAGAKGPRPCVVRAVRARRPPGPLRFSAGQTSHSPPLSTSASYKQNEPAAPHERRAGIFRRKTEEVFQLVFPRFFQKRKGGGAERRQWRKKRGGSPVSKGVEGSRFSGDAQRPLRTARGAGSPPHEPPNGVQGRSPWRGPGQRPGSRAPSRHPEQAAGVLEGGVQQLRQGALVELRQLLGDEGEEGGVVALAPVGHRGHVGAIGLQ